MESSVETPRPGSQIDLAPFGTLKYYPGGVRQEMVALDARSENGSYLPSDPDAEGRSHLGIEWEDPRDIKAVAITYEDGSAPDPGEVEVQYWHRNWPFPLTDGSRGAHRGWFGRDDHYNGRWVTAICDIASDGGRTVYDFCHLDLTEIGDSRRLEEAEDFNAEYRCALKFRLVFPKGSAPKIRRIEAIGRGQWRRGQADIFGVSECSVDAYNGHVIGVKKSGDALSIEYLYIPTPPDDFPHRRTVITVNDETHPFSFCAADLETAPIYIRDFGIVVRPAGDSRSPEKIIEHMEASGTPCIYDRVFDEPEQTLDRAMAETPRLRAPFQGRPWGRYVPLGCEGSRQRFALRYNANVFVDKRDLKPAGRDLVDLLWSGSTMQYRFATGDPPNFREYERACEQSWSGDGAPVIESTWVDRDIEYKQTAFAAYLREDMGDYFGKKGDEDIVLLVRFEIRNISHDAGRAHLWLQTSPMERYVFADGVMSATGRLVRTEVVDSDELACNMENPANPRTFNWVEKPYPEQLIRCRIDMGQGCGDVTPLRSDREGPGALQTAFHYEVCLHGGERDVITVVIPYCTLKGDDGLRLLGSIDYNQKLRDVRNFWVPFVDSGAQIKVPDRLIEDFYRFVPVHVAITATRDPGSGEYMLPAATFCYGSCGNEACIQILQMDYRGHHAQAEKYLDGLLLTQGAFTMDGNFRTREGTLQGIDFYNGRPLSQPFSYNTDHGFILWTLCEHYLLTRDRQWLSRVADNLVAASDFVIRERQATMIEHNGRKVREYGLLPAGHLEDNDEWRYWFAVNAHAYYGVRQTARVLGEIGHSEASRLAREAEAYRKDILAAVERARIEAPVVTLPDNTSIPHIPARTDIRGPEWGWFREGAYGALHLVDGRLLDPNDERVTWTMKYLEDLVYPTRNWGRPIDLEKRWFSQAGVTIQANLLNNGTAYVRRDEPKHAVRALFNDFAASIYPDVLVFTEHPVIQLSRGVGPFYKTPDECGFLNTLRNCLVTEEGDSLYLAKAAPVSWLKAGETVEVRDAATHFGPVSYKVRVTEDSMEVHVAPPRRNPPAQLKMRLRRADGKPIKSVTVNGEPADFHADTQSLTLDPAQSDITITASC